MRTLMAALVVLVSASCASTGGAPTARKDQSFIDRAEIEASNQMNALDLVRTLRPHWLRHRGVASIANDPVVSIYIDGVRAGGPDALNGLPTINIESLRYYDASQAQFRFGVGHLHGAIEVHTRRGR